MSLTSNLQFTVTSNLSSALDLATRLSGLLYPKSFELATGTGADQADMIFSDQRTLAASATEDLDLAGVLTDAFGATMTFARLKLLMVFAATANTNNVVVSRPAANGVPIFAAASDAFAVRPGGCMILFARDATAIAVTAATGDLITFTNSAAGTGVTYDVILIGASA